MKLPPDNFPPITAHYPFSAFSFSWPVKSSAYFTRQLSAFSFQRFSVFPQGLHSALRTPLSALP